ncbi:MAG TPA: DUF3887 domain-containing protein [Anaerolineae bacterium]|nr:DUF3887 domain-containing protein [Anaerolineae bacterium]
MNKGFLILVLIIPFLFLSACQKSSDVNLPDNIQGKSEQMASNLLMSLENHDYENFIRDFNTEMQQVMTEDAFEEMQVDFYAKAGKYQSLQYEKSEIEQDFIVAYFKVLFSEEQLTLRLMLELEEPHNIAGMWFPDFPVD